MGFLTYLVYFLFGLLISLFPVYLCFKIFRGKFLLVENRYMKGALFGFLLWVLVNVLFSVEARYGFLGIFGATGGEVILLFSSPLVSWGFISGGLLIGAVSKRRQ